MSGPTIELVAARLTHCGPISSRMREADRVECAALGRTPKEAVRLGLVSSIDPVAVLADGQPAAVFGVMPVSMISGEGVVWLLGTERFYDCRRAMLRIGPQIIAGMMRDFRSVSNIVSTDNVRAIRFLRWLGFSVSSEVETHRGVAFHPFSLSRDSRR